MRHAFGIRTTHIVSDLCQICARKIHRVLIAPAPRERAARRDVAAVRCHRDSIQSSGNLKSSRPAPRPGIAEHLASGKPYPTYLAESACRVANPSQSLQALTVGSVAYCAFEETGWRSLASDNGQPSAFSRAQLGIWDSIKPEVVEFGGDSLVSGGNPPTVDTPTVGRDCYPELLRSTMHGGPAFDRDEVGTSYAAPKVTRIAARLQSIPPDESCLLYRALIVQSARWPEWSTGLRAEDQASLLRRIGFGIPDIERATTNTGFRTTFIMHQEQPLDRGVDAMMPESAMVRVYAAIHRRHLAGDRPGAQRLFRRLLPVLAFTNQDVATSVAFFKRLLVRKGIFDTGAMRMLGFAWDRHNRRIADELMDHYLRLDYDTYPSGDHRPERTSP